jgi:hypothetical protein
MPFLSDLSSQETDDENSHLAAASPVPASSTPGFLDAYSAASDENRYYSGLYGDYHAQADFIQQSLDAYHQRTGETLDNPMTMAFGLPTADQQAAQFAKVRDKFNALGAQDLAQAGGVSGEPLTFPTDEQIVAGGAGLARKAMGRAAEVGQNGGPMALLGSLAAQFADAATDPINGFAVAAMPEGGLVLRALSSSALFANAQIETEFLTAQQKAALNPNYGLGEAAGDVGEAALGGAAFELGGAAIGKVAGLAWRRFANRAPDAAAALPLDVRDAGTVAERQGDLDAQNPFQGAGGEAAHNEAIGTIEPQIIAGEAREAPASATAEAQTPTSDVFAPTPDTGDMPRDEWNRALATRASAIDPDTMRQAYDLDNRIDQARSQIAELQAAPPPAYALGQSRLDDAMAELAAITGKRRSSPRAKALREEILSLHAQGAQSAADVAGAQADRAQTLRMSLNDLQNDRARLGPNVNAAMSQAEREARAMGFRPVDEAATAGAEPNPSHSGSPFVEPARGEPFKAARPMPARAVGKPGDQLDLAGRERASPSTPTETGVSGESSPASASPPAPAEPPPRAAPAERSAFYGGNRAVKVKYQLAEARDLVTSHDDGFHENPAYPQNWQPRARGGKPATAQVLEILNDLQPERLGPSPEANSGAPIVGPDNIVESGNGRAMALRMAYGRDSAGGYRAFLEREGYDTGGFKEPVLIGRRVTPMNDAEREAFAHAANGSASLGMSPTEQAISDARFLTPDVAALAKRGEVTSAGNRDFVRALLAKFGSGEAGRLQGLNGELSAVGVNRIRAAMFARAYGDPAVVARLYEHVDPNIKTIGHALSAGAADWIKMRDAVTRGDIPSTQDMTPHLMDGVKAIMRARDIGRPVSEVLAQGDMFAGDQTSLVVRLFLKNGDTSRFLAKDAMAKNVTDFAHDLTASVEAGPSLLGEAPRSAQEVLRDTIDASDRRTAALVEAANSSDAIAKALDDPAHDAALFADLERNVEQGDNRYITDGGEVGIADPELASIASDETLAQEINACNTPQPAEAAE